ncbi:MAG: PHP domain-containing protein [Verrucomicrobia bacterium]|nr:PHP domain-containing protein [Verrucomicrobiota bacterium]
MLKCDFHIHAREDALDCCDYGARDVVEKAAALKFDVLAFTFHGQVLDDPAVTALARERGILLIPGCEVFVERREVLCLNITQAEVDRMHTFEDLRAWKRAKGEAGLVIAPHPLYPVPQCLRRKFFEQMDLWDAVEVCHMHIRGLNFNRRAERVAKERGLPLVATSDAHQLFMFGANHTLVDAEKEMLPVFRAIRAGKVRHYSPPLSPWGAFKVLACMEVKDRLARIFTAQGRAKQRARRERIERASQPLEKKGRG